MRVRKVILGHSSPRTGEHEIDAPAAALRAHQPLDPIAHRQIGAVASNLFGRVGLETFVPAFRKWLC